MKAIMVMFDSLRRDLLACNGGDVPTPNFDRLAEHSVSFNACYVGSLPCMPARRELHTGRYNFLHRSWGPVEPFDDSMPEILKNNGVHTRLSTDHFHYFEDGGATYHNRYSTWNAFRGQECDCYVADLKPKEAQFSKHLSGAENLSGMMAKFKSVTSLQGDANRKVLGDETTYSIWHTFDDGLDFLEKNGQYDNWFLQIEAFDPHEPFVSPETFNGRYFSPDFPFDYDWPTAGKVGESEEVISGIRKKYYALLEFCDSQLGRVLDKMDEMDLWKDTMLIVNTDHGFLLAEHDCWAKGASPDYEELSHIPLFIWDPRSGIKGETRNQLVQTIDLAPTLLEYFGVEIPKDMEGRSLRTVIENNESIHEYAMFGYHGMPVGITDGRYILLRAIQENTDVFEYTLMPTHIMMRFSVEELKKTTLSEGFSFTKELPVLKIAKPSHGIGGGMMQKLGEDLLFDLNNDPKQMSPIEDEETKQRLLTALKGLFDRNDAPKEMYVRYGLPR